MNYSEQYSQWLSAFLDGELELPAEEQLFAALAGDADLRQEFRELLALRHAARKDMITLIPPLSTTAAVFQGIGIGSVTAGGIGLLYKLWLPLATAILGGGLTWFTMTMLSTRPIPSNSGYTTAGAAPSYNPVPQQPATVERVVYRTRTVYLPSLQPTQTATRVPYTDEPIAPTPSGISPQPTLYAEAYEPEGGSQPLVIRRYPLNVARSDMTVLDTPSQMTSSERHPQFRVLLRGLGTTSLVSVPQQPDRTSLLNTSALGMFYTLDEHHAIGIEVGREPFAMRFFGYYTDTRLRYEAYPSLLWGTASYQYRAHWGSQWEPYVQVGIGATEFGLLGRATAGLMYIPARSLGAFVGIDGSLMRYVHQSMPYMTPNVGITYGIMFRF